MNITIALHSYLHTAFIDQRIIKESTAHAQVYQSTKLLNNQLLKLKFDQIETSNKHLYYNLDFNNEGDYEKSIVLLSPHIDELVMLFDQHADKKLFKEQTKADYPFAIVATNKDEVRQNGSPYQYGITTSDSSQLSCLSITQAVKYTYPKDSVIKPLTGNEDKETIVNTLVRGIVKSSSLDDILNDYAHLIKDDLNKLPINELLDVYKKMTGRDIKTSVIQKLTKNSNNIEL